MKRIFIAQFILFSLAKLVQECESSVTENTFCSVPHCQVWIWKNQAHPSQIYPSSRVAQKRSGSVNDDVLEVIDDIDQRLATTLENLRQKIQPTIKSVENDIFSSNVNSIILALSNGLGGFYGALAGAGGIYNLNEISGGSKIQVLAQVMYGYGYSTPWSWKYQDPRVHCGRKEFERVMEDYGFLNSPEEYQNIDKNVFSYYVSEFLKSVKLEMNCLVSRGGTNQDAKEFTALLDLYAMLLIEKINQSFSNSKIVKRSLEHKKRSENNKEDKLETILNKIRDQIPKSIKSIEGDIFQSNVNNMILSISNGLGAVFGALAGTGGVFNLNQLTGGSKMQVLAQMMYGYGYSRPYQDNYKSPRLHCGLHDLEEVLDEYEFLRNPQPGLPTSVLEFYVQEMNKELRRRLFCLVSQGGTNQEARELDALIDLYIDTLSSTF